MLSDELLRAAREACDRTGAALVFDEIQTGMGRTGTLWAYEQTGVVPDALTSAKALGGGLPIGALVTGPRLADVLQPGDHGSTFAGGPVVCAAALVALEICSDPELLGAGARARRAACRPGSRELPDVAAVRGRGLMVGVDLDPRRAAPELARGRCSSSGWSSTRPARHDPARAAADRDRGGDRRRRRAARGARAVSGSELLLPDEMTLARRRRGARARGCRSRTA